jgi:hypothetical protein
MATRKELRQAIDQRLRLIHGSATATRTATGGSTTTLVDTARGEADNFWATYWLFIPTTSDALAPQGEEALVTSFSAVTDTLTFEPAMTAAIGNTDTYELRRYFSAEMIHGAINASIEECLVHFPNLAVDETTVIKTDISEYTLAATIADIQRIDLLHHEVKNQGTATAGAALTLTDTGKAWTINNYAGYEVAIYDGTGAGQYRTISSNTATALTISVAWTTNPDSTSKYKIKDVTVSPPSGNIAFMRYVNNVLYLNQALEEGQRLRITYAAAHAKLTSDTSTTSIPETLIIDRALYRVLTGASIVLPSDDMARRANQVAQASRDSSQRFINANGGKHASRSLWNRGSTGRKTRWRGSGRSIGTREKV